MYKQNNQFNVFKIPRATAKNERIEKTSADSHSKYAAKEINTTQNDLMFIE